MQTTDAGISVARAVLTSNWNGRSYRPLAVRQIESYYIDSSLDNDTDAWVLEIGDPEHQYLAALRRDNEVRVQIYGVLRNNAIPISTGVADEISYDDSGVIRFVGRDMTALAVDSTAPPRQYRHVRAWSIVEQQAREIGIRGRLNLAKVGMVRKTQYTDGSESYWEFWHRLYRKEKMWIWGDSLGGMTAGPLNYNEIPVYYFGSPAPGSSERTRERYIPVERFEMRKSHQQRVGEVWVYGHKGDNGFLVIEDDPTTRHWVKRPRRILLDTDARNLKAAQRTAWEEIFEGKVGSVEFSITIPDPGYLIRQNHVCELRLPDQGIAGSYFVVGARAQAGSDGAVQEIRLRERQYAASRRVPRDPKLKTKEPAKDTAAGLGSEIEMVTDIKQEWGDFFVKAARKWHGPWDYSLYLATLIAIADQETGGTFTNIRANGGPGEDRVEWYPWEAQRGYNPAHEDVADTGPVRDRHGRTLEEWKEIFANEPGQYTNNKTFAVGPLQLYSLIYKHYADDLLKPGNRDQWTGGRWSPEHNIMAAARVLREKLQTAVRDSGRDIDLWAGVSLYGHNAHLYEPGKPTPYAISVKNKVYNDPGYLRAVQDAVEASREAAEAARDGNTDGQQTDDGAPAYGLPNRLQALATLRTGSALFASRLEMRRRVVAAAMYGYYERDRITYVSPGTPESAFRDNDFAPPPNVPERTDCSAFAEWCYKSAGAQSPSGAANFKWIGSTYTQQSRGQVVNSVAQLRPGDLVFYEHPAHVGVYVGYNQVVQLGSSPGPLLSRVDYRPIAAMRSYL